MSTTGSSKQRSLIIILIILGCLLVTFFGLRAFHAFKKFNGHRPPPPASAEIETDVELIRDWMTIPFIARTYWVPEKEIFDALGISPKDNREKSLKEINEEYFPKQDGLAIELVKTAVLAHQPPLTVVPPQTAVPPLTPVPPASP
ncbi:MAG: hypothetical protein IH589_07565 [Anaerolineales bacterium]|nr:hypothetical protein [Anaerolineales bacterium]